MRVHKHIEAVISGDSENLNGVLNPFFVVYSRSSRLNGFPCENIADAVIAVPLQSRKVQSSILLGEGSGAKVDLVTVEEVVGYM